MPLTPAFAEELARRRAVLSAELATHPALPRRLVWEVGCGHGHFLAARAAREPDRFFLGVDLCRDRIARARRKSARARLSNCLFVQCDAREFLCALPGEIAFEEIWILFPDPWPKKRHHKNRLLQSEFLEAAAARVGQGGRLYFRTDHGGYFSSAFATIAAAKTWTLDEAAPWPLELSTVFQARAPSYQSLVAVRTAHPATPRESTAPRPPQSAAPKSPA